MRRVAVVGAGVMGGGIAQWVSAKDIPVLLRDLNPEAVARGIAQEMERDPKVFVFGLDVDDPKGIQGSTLGLQQEFGISYGAVQLTLTLYLVGMAACQLIYGPLSDRFGRRPMLLGGLCVFVVASLLAAVAPNIGVLIAARLLQAIGEKADAGHARHRQHQRDRQHAQFAGPPVAP